MWHHWMLTGWRQANSFSFKNISLLYYIFLAVGSIWPRQTNMHKSLLSRAAELSEPCALQGAVGTRAPSPGSALGCCSMAQPSSEGYEPLEAPAHFQTQKACHLPTDLLYRLLAVLHGTDLGELKKPFVAIETAGLCTTVQADIWKYYCLAFFQVSRLRIAKKL